MHKILHICDDCHQEIHQMLPDRMLEKDEYVAITMMWMRGIDVTVL